MTTRNVTQKEAYLAGDVSNEDKPTIKQRCGRQTHPRQNETLSDSAKSICFNERRQEMQIRSKAKTKWSFECSIWKTVEKFQQNQEPAEYATKRVHKRLHIVP